MFTSAFPFQVTVQFYKATSNGTISEADVQEIAQQTQRVYHDAAYVGSLVVEDDTGRPTEYNSVKEEPPSWWDVFGGRFESNTGLSRQEAVDSWRKLKMNVGW